MAIGHHYITRVNIRRICIVLLPLPLNWPTNSSKTAKANLKTMSNIPRDSYLRGQLNHFLHTWSILTLHDQKYWFLGAIECEVAIVTRLVDAIVAGWQDEGITDMSYFQVTGGKPLNEVVAMVQRIVIGYLQAWGAVITLR